MKTSRLRRFLREMLCSLGYDLHQLPLPSLTLRDLDFDISHLVAKRCPVVFDVGANAGQSIELIKRNFEKYRIFAFEPNPEMFCELIRRYASDKVTIEQIACGEAEGLHVFNINRNSELSSLLDMGSAGAQLFGDDKCVEKINVKVSTIDSYIKDHGIVSVDILKIDCQGFDFQVLKGADSALKRGVFGIILVEINFIKMYKDQGGIYDIQEYLANSGYELVTFYEIVRINSVIKWVTACFKRES